MEVREARPSDLKELSDFILRMFPERGIHGCQILNFWIAKSKDAIQDILLLLNDDNNIVGQVFTSPMTFYYKGSKMPSEWGFDLIVEEKYRKKSWGLDLMMANIERHPNMFATGSGPMALSINLKIGMKSLGEIRKYLGMGNPLWMLSSIGRGVVSVDKFPALVKSGNNSFVRVGKDELLSIKQPYNSQLLEISREKEFIQWRFFNDLHDYVVYKDECSDSFFVLRTIVQRHITAMVLVDYRCNASDGSAFETILKAARHITSKLRLSVLITGSSLHEFDAVLEHHGYKSMGRPRPILGFLKCKDRREDIERRDFCFVTLADSDGEIYW